MARFQLGAQELDRPKRNTKRRFLDWEPARPLQGSLTPSRPEMPKKSRKCLAGPLDRVPEKVSKKSREQSGKSPESLRKVSGECFWTFSGLFGDFFRVPGQRPRETFSRLFRHFGPGGPERPLQGAGWFPILGCQDDRSRATPNAGFLCNIPQESYFRSCC